MLGSILVFENNEKTISSIHRLTQIDRDVTFYFAVEAREGMDQLRKNRFDMILLCPECSGVIGEKTVEQIRLLVATPIIILSNEGRETQILNLFTKGIDDYMIKPISTFELAARIKAIYRRSSIQRFYQEDVLKIGNNVISMQNFTFSKNGQTIALTHTEYAVLKLLASYPERIFSKAEMCQKLWQYENDEYCNVLSVHIRRLRLKIEDNPAQPTIIVTRWGVGYQIGTISKE